jgi:ADP-ribose pyrophosphatase YjhB (NUDIX family)
VIVRHYDLDDLFHVLKRITKSVPAAGGVVWNEYSQVLFIFRKGKWDLPKGKLDKGEHPRRASVREVQEECGLEQVELSGYAGSTYHIYKQGGELCLKKTYWYHMKSVSAEELVPQLEEDITDVQWVSVTDIPEKLTNAYSAIKELADQVILHYKFE